MSGKRRNPFAFRVTTGFDLNGKQQYQYLAFFRTRKEALEYQAEYNLNPKTKRALMTFTDVYNLWSKKHFQEISTTMAKSYQYAYSKCEEIHDKLIVTIEQKTLQELIDKDETVGGARTLYVVFKLVYDYAERNEIITPSQNRAKYLEVPKKIKSDARYRFNDNELKILWDNKDDEQVQIILTLIYTGCRPMEYFKLTQDDVKGNYFVIRGGKTENAKREVPIHKDIAPFFHLVDNVTTQSQYVGWRKKFERTMKRLGILYQGEKKATPYCCRHTFTSLWFESQLNETYRRFIQGHSRNGVGEETYAHISIDALKKELDRLPTW